MSKRLLMSDKELAKACLSEYVGQIRYQAKYRLWIHMIITVAWSEAPSRVEWIFLDHSLVEDAYDPEVLGTATRCNTEITLQW